MEKSKKILFITITCVVVLIAVIVAATVLLNGGQEDPETLTLEESTDVLNDGDDLTQEPLVEEPLHEREQAQDMDGCFDWLSEMNSTDYSNHECGSYNEMLQDVRSYDAYAVPVGKDRFFLVWFPQDWGDHKEKTLAVLLHGSGGCSEKMFSWYQDELTITEASDRNIAFISLQYAQSADGLISYDDAYQMYNNLSSTLKDLGNHCPIADATTVYHGYSKGSARAHEIAALDIGDEGRNLFDAYVLDSGTVWSDLAKGETSEILENILSDGYGDQHFWLYCGQEDEEGQTCKDMSRTEKFLEAHAGIIDEYYTNTTGGHGIFQGEDEQDTKNAIETLFDYMESL